MTIPVDLKQIDELVERLRSYATSLDALRQGVSLDESQRLANVTPALSARAMSEAADTIESLSSLIDDTRRMAETACGLGACPSGAVARSGNRPSRADKLSTFLLSLIKPTENMLWLERAAAQLQSSKHDGDGM